MANSSTTDAQADEIPDYFSRSRIVVGLGVAILITSNIPVRATANIAITLIVIAPKQRQCHTATAIFKLAQFGSPHLLRGACGDARYSGWPG